ncbi:MAG: hypothetical protein K940chlam8_01324, partial [Chlamydiae bacterium]|nr:hypothetical protein [Chlamydiota bacterium]
LENALEFDLKDKLCKLYKWQNKINQYIESMQKLLDQTQSSLEKAHLYFKIAKAYLTQKRTHFARKYFDFAMKTAAFSKYADFAKFHIVKMEMDFCQNEADSIPLLAHLKDLQMKKCLSYEPMFLDASLLYVGLSVRFLPKNKQVEKELFLLKRMKADFTTQKDLFSKEYHNQLKLQQKNAHIYHSYMQFIDQRIAFLEAKIQNDQKREQIVFKKVLEKKDAFIKISKILEKQFNTMQWQ